ncbi:MAG: 30S ribosomal protein S12 methylthiotransferase RimO [Planctomycetota bacterium]|nr:30S ribosomal protein S12 methylthiotransferase RimO [Planctomycetota bacterium]MCX8039010.1 30S ribosomal protein S12 methylthiotransferase RimO [Planctomycetota bacterium]MDW8372739.1 30S ribosomal protein S12 methylthiotransferase RimO [Planctomycetota bacterium]
MAAVRAALISLGCAKNLSDSERLVGELKGLGIALTDRLEAADLVLINTCGFIEPAKQESIERILGAAQARRPGAKLFVAGCLTERYLEALRAELPEVDVWVPFADYSRFADLVRRHVPGLPEHRLRHDERVQLTPPHYAYLKIAEGCDNDCNFCAIPRFRGRHRSRPFAELVEEARALQRRGVREIILISQHLDYYHRDLDGQARLPQLVRAIAAAAPQSWIRLHYCYPNDFSDELIAAMAETPNVCRYVDMPLQHASDRMLAVMGRRTTRARIVERLDAIVRAMPDAVLRTAFIVGHPGERPTDVACLERFIAEGRFDHGGVFAYSDEEGTVSARMPKKLSPRTIAARRRRIERALAQALAERAARWLGQELTVLVDAARDFGLFACRHYGQSPGVDSVVLVEDDRLQPGMWARVRVRGLRGLDLLADCLERDAAAPFLEAPACRAGLS